MQGWAEQAKAAENRQGLILLVEGEGTAREPLQRASGSSDVETDKSLKQTEVKDSFGGCFYRGKREIASKGVVSRIHKEISTLKNEKQTIQLENGQKAQRDISPKRIYEWHISA